MRRSLRGLADHEPERSRHVVARGVAGDDGDVPVALWHGCRAAGAGEREVAVLPGAREGELDAAAGALAVLGAPEHARAGLRGAEERRRRVADDGEGAE